MNLLKKIYFIFFGFSVIILTIYLRLFRNKDPLSLEIIKERFASGDSPLSFIIFFYFCLIHLTILITIIYQIYKNYYNLTSNSKIIEKIREIIHFFYWQPLEYLHDIFSNYTPGMIYIFITEAIDRGNSSFRYKIYSNSYLIFSFVPQIIVSSTFLVEITYYKILHNFFYTLGLLLLPIIFNIYLRFGKTYVEKSLPQFYEYFNIKTKKKKDGNYKIKFTYKHEYRNNSKKLLEEYAKGFLMIQTMDLYLIEIKEKKDRYYPYLLLLTSSFYLIGGIYRLDYIMIQNPII